MVFHYHRGSQLAWLVWQGAAAPVDHHDGAGRVPAHGRSLSGVPISSSSPRASGCSARWRTTRSPSARIASRRIRRASASAISRTNVLSPLPCPRAAASSAARSSASNRIVSVSATDTSVTRARKTRVDSVSASRCSASAVLHRGRSNASCVRRAAARVADLAVTGAVGAVEDEAFRERSAVRRNPRARYRPILRHCYSQPAYGGSRLMSWVPPCPRHVRESPRKGANCRQPMST